jgi:chromosome segregation ATPase
VADRDMKIRMLLAASDRVSRPLRDIAGGSRAATEALRGTRERLREVDRAQEQLNSFTTLRAGMRSSAAAMRAAEQRAAALGREIEQTAKPTRAMKREFAEATRAAEQLANSHPPRRAAAARAAHRPPGGRRQHPRPGGLRAQSGRPLRQHQPRAG